MKRKSIVTCETAQFVLYNPIKTATQSFGRTLSDIVCCVLNFPDSDDTKICRHVRMFHLETNLPRFLYTKNETNVLVSLD